MPKTVSVKGAELEWSEARCAAHLRPGTIFDSNVTTLIAGVVPEDHGADWERARDVENVMARLALSGPAAGGGITWPV